jgi:hypothetical protein
MKTLTTKRLLHNIVIFMCVIMIAIGLHLGKSEQQAAAIPIIDIEKTHVTHIELKSPTQQTLALTKTNSQWYLIEPQAALANTTVLQQILSMLDVQSRQHYDADTLTLNEYGLVCPCTTLSFNHIEIVIGDHEPVENKRFIMANGKVHVLSNIHFEFLEYADSAFINAQQPNP